VSITITWTPPNDSQHNYTVASAILAPDAP
jgi:hypothetical protein